MIKRFCEVEIWLFVVFVIYGVDKINSLYKGKFFWSGWVRYLLVFIKEWKYFGECVN